MPDETIFRKTNHKLRNEIVKPGSFNTKFHNVKTMIIICSVAGNFSTFRNSNYITNDTLPSL